jgi:hypothetical protein
MAHGAYVHYAWWNNLLAPYMERPLHYSQSHPGELSPDGLSKFDSVDNAASKALPGEDYQFVADAKLFLSAIREHNPSAIIIVVGHSMGGGAVVHLGVQTKVLVDILAPIDAVGNRNYPWAGPAALLGPVSAVKPYANWTRWRVTRDTFLGFRSLDFRLGNGCFATGPWLKDINEISNDLRCAGKPVSYDAAPAIHFGTNVINLHYRYQKEALFPFDYDQDYVFGHSKPDCGSTSQRDVPMTDEFCGGFPPERCSDPGGWPNTLDVSSPCCQTGDGVGWPKDGHGEIVGYRGPLPNPIPLGVRVRTSPQCGDCPNQSWPARAEASNGRWSDPNGAGRATLLRELETIPLGNIWTHRPVNPNLCLVSQELIEKFDAMNKPPVANAGPDQFVECPGTNGAAVILNGSGSSDPDKKDTLTYDWTWESGNAHGVAPTVVLSGGVHCITLTVRDRPGHVARDVTTVVVQDTTPPELRVSLAPRLLWPPNHAMRNISATVGAQDSCGEVASLVLMSIVSNQPDNERGDGNTSGDIADAAFDTLDLAFKVRAERAGPKSDRIYTVTYQATDDSGNRAIASDYIVVPHDANSYRQWQQRLKQ